jgi:hypothetical protein
MDRGRGKLPQTLILLAKKRNSDVCCIVVGIVILVMDELPLLFLVDLIIDSVQ